MLSCQECERYLPVFLDHALEVKESLDVQAHLLDCLADAQHRWPARAYSEDPDQVDVVRRITVEVTAREALQRQRLKSRSRCIHCYNRGMGKRR